MSWSSCPTQTLNAECIHAYVLLLYCTCVTKPKGVFSHRSQNAVRHIALRQIVFYCLMDSEPEIPHTHTGSLSFSFSVSHLPCHTIPSAMRSPHHIPVLESPCHQSLLTQFDQSDHSTDRSGLTWGVRGLGIHGTHLIHNVNAHWPFLAHIICCVHTNALL